MQSPCAGYGSASQLVATNRGVVVAQVGGVDVGPVPPRHEVEVLDIRRVGRSLQGVDPGVADRTRWQPPEAVSYNFV